MKEQTTVWPGVQVLRELCLLSPAKQDMTSSKDTTPSYLHAGDPPRQGRCLISTDTMLSGPQVTLREPHTLSQWEAGSGCLETATIATLTKKRALLNFFHV